MYFCVSSKFVQLKPILLAVCSSLESTGALTRKWKKTHTHAKIHWVLGTVLIFSSNRAKNCAGSPLFLPSHDTGKIFLKTLFLLKEYVNHFKMDICMQACGFAYMYYFDITISNPIANKELEISKRLNK